MCHFGATDLKLRVKAVQGFRSGIVFSDFFMSKTVLTIASDSGHKKSAKWTTVAIKVGSVRMLRTGNDHSGAQHGLVN
jgi:hypothetical protein